MNIGDVSRLSGLPAKTIRYYEDIGLVEPLRSENGYRAFRQSDVHKLTFLGRSRSLGFTIDDCRSLLKLYEDRDRASADVRQIALEQLDRIDGKLAELAAMRETLSHLVEACAGDQRPDCPILADLAAEDDDPLANTHRAAPRNV
jgi:Cu(I)-responsive transcriptional regulator